MSNLIEINPQIGRMMEAQTGTWRSFTTAVEGISVFICAGCVSGEGGIRFQIPPDGDDEEEAQMKNVENRSIHIRLTRASDMAFTGDDYYLAGGCKHLTDVEYLLRLHLIRLDNRTPISASASAWVPFGTNQ